MGRLVRKINGEVAVAHNYVATPDYTLYVEDYSGGATPPHGWEYYAEDVKVEDFAPPWKQPVGADDAYTFGAIVEHSGTRWRSTIVGNVWEPGVSGWQDADSDIPIWIQPTGAHDAYAVESIVRHNGSLWRSLVPANVWEPGVSGWRKFGIIAPDGSSAPPMWIQPTGAHDAYALGALVTHNNQVWRSIISANVWEPGVYGWVLG